MGYCSMLNIIFWACHFNSMELQNPILYSEGLENLIESLYSKDLCLETLDFSTKTYLRNNVF